MTQAAQAAAGQEKVTDWIGNTETAADVVTAAPYSGLSVTLDRPADRPAAGTPLPELWHWLYFLPMAPQSLLGPDGHPVRGGFLPPVPLPRRMWAGSQLQWFKPIRIGDSLSRLSTIADVTEKSGRTGTLVFVNVRHEYRIGHDADPALHETHNIVYRPAPQPGDVAPPPKAAPGSPAWERRIVPDDVFLFRYSALTFNGHRIHYDRRYVTEVEGYPGLIVHGPLIATLLLDAMRRQMPDTRLKSLEFRALRPTFDLNPFFVCGAPHGDGGKTFHLWARDHEGWLTMDATAVVA